MNNLRSVSALPSQTPPAADSNAPEIVRTGTTANFTNRLAKLMISYCWNDKEVVHFVAQVLRDNNFEVWLDNTHMPVQINEAIPAAIDDADAVIAFISEDSVESRYCKQELNYANDRNKPIIPVRLTNSPTPGATDFLTAGKLYVPLHPSIWYNNTLRKEHLGYLIKNIASELKLLQTNPVTVNSLEPPVPGIATPPLPWSDPKHYIGREEIWHQLDSDFATGYLCILRGVGGSGKTFAACKYAHQRLQSGQNVAWLKCDSAQNAQSSYHEFAFAVSRFAQNTGKLADLYELPFNQVLTENVHNPIGSKFFIILDNVDHYSDVEHIVHAHITAKSQVLITTRYILTPAAETQALNSIQVTIPSEQACILFFASLENRKISQEDAKQITAACNQLPLRVHIAASYLSKVENQKKNKVTDDQIYPEVSLSIDSLSTSNIKAYSFLLLLAFLDPDAIYWTFIEEWLSTVHVWSNFSISWTDKKILPHAAEIDSCISQLENLALVTQTFQGKVLTIHRCIQAYVREKIYFLKSSTMIAQNLKKFYDSSITSQDRFRKSLFGNDVIGIAAYLATQTSLDLSADEFKIGASGAQAIADALQENKSLQSLNLR
ncbi:hypothetical protein HK100_008254, partial [Physocladia obscura]